jgi:predicted amidohydrolase
LICADNVYPESARTATLKGAEIICVPYARRKGLAKDPDMYDRLASCRAYENETFVIACNRVGKERNTVFEGRTVICGPKGDYLARTETDDEMVLTADLVGEELLSMRLELPRFRDRRPEQYGAICQPL